MTELTDKVEKILENARRIEYREVLGAKTDFGERAIPDQAFPLFYDAINPYFETLWLTVSEPYPWATKTIALWNARPKVYYGDGLPIMEINKNENMLITQAITTDEEIITVIAGSRTPEIFHNRKIWNGSNFWNLIKSRFYQLKGGEKNGKFR